MATVAVVIPKLPWVSNRLLFLFPLLRRGGGVGGDSCGVGKEGTGRRKGECWERDVADIIEQSHRRRVAFFSDPPDDRSL